MNERHLPRLGFALALAVLLALPAVAGPRPAPHGPGAMWGGPGDAAMFFEHLKYRLELTDDQKAELERIGEARHPEFQALHEKMAPAHTALFDAMHADVFDEAAIRSAAAAVAVIDADFAVARAALFRDIRAMLTPDQQEEAKEMIGEMRAFHEDHPDGPGPHGGPPHRHAHPGGRGN